SQGGKFPDNKEKEMFDLLHYALKWGCEYVDVEIGTSRDLVTKLIRSKGHTKIIASWHDISGRMKWNGDEVKEVYKTANDCGDIIKIIGVANELNDNFALYEFVASLPSDSKP